MGVPTVMRHKITFPAERDIKSILSETAKNFGTVQLGVYEEIINRGIAMVAEDPLRASSIERNSIHDGVRLFHLEHAAGRRGGAAHCIYYAIAQMSDGLESVVVLRVLHEHMEPRARVIRSIGTMNDNEEDDRSPP